MPGTFCSSSVSQNHTYVILRHLLVSQPVSNVCTTTSNWEKDFFVRSPRIPLLKREFSCPAFVISMLSENTIPTGWIVYRLGGNDCLTSLLDQGQTPESMLYVKVSESAKGRKWKGTVPRETVKNQWQGYRDFEVDWLLKGESNLGI